MDTVVKAPPEVLSAVKAIKSLVKDGAAEHARLQAIELNEKYPRCVEPLISLSKIAEIQSDFIQSAHVAEKAFELQPGDPSHLVQASFAWVRAGHVDKALAALGRGIDRHPGFIAYQINLANAYERQNSNDEAMEVVTQGRRKGIEAYAFDMIEGKILIKNKRWDEAEVVLKGMLERDDSPPESLAAARFQLVKLYDKTERYDDAFATATEAYEKLNWTAPVGMFVERLDEAIEVYSSRNLKMWRRPTIDNELPICIVGMPRSGTSLVEQIFGMHSQIAQAGEISASSIMTVRAQHVCDSYHNYPTCLIDMQPEDANRLQQLFLEYVEPYRGDALRVSNKSLMNYEHLGLMSVIFPGMQALHIKRHPLDNCLSCHLTEIIINQHRYAARLEDLAEVYKARQRVWQHWQDVLDCRMLEIPYESLTADQETWTRRLIDLTGLEWQDSCLDFHKSKRSAMTISYDQVNQKMYRSSVARWRNYEKHLGPLIDALVDEVEEHEALVASQVKSD